MKLIQHISKVEMILRHSRMSRDSRISFPFLADRWNDYRASHIRESYAKHMQYDTTLFQDLGAINVTPRSLQDDPGFPASCTNLGKATIPSIVSMENDAGLVMVASTNKETKYNPCGISEITDRMTLENYKYENWYAKVGNTLWIYPYRDKINVVAILDDPLQGWKLNTETPVNGELVFRTIYGAGEVYKVKAGAITHDGVTYTQGQTFEATQPTWSGSGELVFNTRKRKLTVDDEYPMSATMAEIVMMKILTQDFKLEKAEIADIRNNMLDEATVR